VEALQRRHVVAVSIRQDLDGDGSLQAKLFRFVDRAHRANAELRGDAVRVAQRTPDHRRLVGLDVGGHSSVNQKQSGCHRNPQRFSVFTTERRHSL